MASIRKRGNSYLLVVSMGYTPDGRRRNPQQKTVKPPTGLTPKQTEKWLQEQAMLFEMSCKKLNPDIDRSITLEKYTEIWLQTIAPDKLAKSTLVREKQDIERFKPYLGSYKLVDLRSEHFRSLYAKLRKQKNKSNGKPLSEATVEGVHSCLCGILSDAMEGGYANVLPAVNACGNCNRFAGFPAADQRGRDRHARLRHMKEDFLFGIFRVFHACFGQSTSSASTNRFVICTGIGRRLCLTARSTISLSSAQQGLSIVTMVTLATSLRLKISASFTVISKSFSGQQISGTRPLDSASWKPG